MVNPLVQLAWREKLALNILIWLLCGTTLFWIIGLTRIICPDRKILSQGEIDAFNELDNPVVSIYGHYYKINDILRTHTIQQQLLNAEAMKATILGRDVSAMFYKTGLWDDMCPGIPRPAGWDNIIRTIPSNYERIWYPHQATDSKTKKQRDYLYMIEPMLRGQVARDDKWIESTLAADPLRHRIIVAYGRVYDVSTYFDDVNRNNFLGDAFKNIFASLGPYGKDATPFFDKLRPMYDAPRWRNLMRCMDGLFFVGVVDDRSSLKCVLSNYILLGSSILLVAIIGFKFLAALQGMTHKRSPAAFNRHVIVQIPCYTEGSESMAKTIDSVALSQYADTHKLMFVICDGLITGSGNDRSTPEIVMSILGVPYSATSFMTASSVSRLGIHRQQDLNDPKMYPSLGEGDDHVNRAKVFSGFYAKQGHKVPFILVVKMGMEYELRGIRPGNRGKRDSQLILMRFLSRVHFDLPMNPLELEIHHQLVYRLQIEPKVFEFLLMVDADTEVMEDSINRLMSVMIQDSNVVGICGETTISNKKETWVTMIQQYEYFISHHMAKAFESLFGSVTCLPGCFCMYRLRSPNMDIPYFVAPSVIQDYEINKVRTLHENNLLRLGEDRYLTTIMMKHFPNKKLCFTSDAKCKTNVPERWGVFLSQRRRWINSTVHNLIELLSLPELCGFCLFSMRFVVFLVSLFPFLMTCCMNGSHLFGFVYTQDLFATVVQPSAVVYIFYLLFTLIFESTDKSNIQSASIPLISILMIAAIYGVQIILLLLQREWQYIGWLFIYVLSMPLYAFYLPLYSFWHFDDFTWGNTRMVRVQSPNDGLEDDVEELKEVKNGSDVVDPADIPVLTWLEYQSLLYERVQKIIAEE